LGAIKYFRSFQIKDWPYIAQIPPRNPIFPKELFDRFCLKRVYLEPPYLGAIKDFRSFQIKAWPYIAHIPPRKTGPISLRYHPEIRFFQQITRISLTVFWFETGVFATALFGGHTLEAFKLKIKDWPYIAHQYSTQKSDFSKK